jgi:hypothetical protein
LQKRIFIIHHVQGRNSSADNAEATLLAKPWLATGATVLGLMVASLLRWLLVLYLKGLPAPYIYTGDFPLLLKGLKGIIPSFLGDALYISIDLLAW